MSDPALAFFNMFVAALVCLLAIAVSVSAQARGVYQINSVQFAQVLLSQQGQLSASLFGIAKVFTGNSIVTLGGQGIASQTVSPFAFIWLRPRTDDGLKWYIEPMPDGSGLFSLQNAQSASYISVSGTPANNSVCVMSSTKFGWSSTSNGISVNGFFITSMSGLVTPVRAICRCRCPHC